ncbi:VOC family protein [Luteimonas saliphila]|uniref:VOC family protein n=1 Tax=Luteimonas saliphila TaxID=2804919 RepID=UPI00192DC4CD|nr:VOC family protein [Luteimonas saliphila]
MSHHSRLAGFMIDCREGALADAAAFWSRALGLPVADPDEGGQGRYAVLGAGPGGLHIEVQKVDHPPRVHLDIETDDVEAEASRLEALGARRIESVRGRWWVMEAPTGHRFCVVPMRAPEQRASPTSWD